MLQRFHNRQKEGAKAILDREESKPPETACFRINGHSPGFPGIVL
jgi:hypothetical protein